MFFLLLSPYAEQVERVFLDEIRSTNKLRNFFPTHCVSKLFSFEPQITQETCVVNHPRIPLVSVKKSFALTQQDVN